MPDTQIVEVTDEELDAAIMGAEPTEEPDPIELTDEVDVDGNVIPPVVTKDPKETIDWEKELNDTKSDFGRKQKAMETQISTLTNSVSDLVNAIKSGRVNEQQADDDFDTDDPIPLTMGGLAEAIDSLMNKKKSNVDREVTQYEGGYLKTIEKLGSDYNDKVHKHIVDRMFKEFNIRHSDNPALDAKLNFRDAETAILREVRERKANPLSKNKGVANKNLGGATNTDQDIRTSAPVKFDKYAADFIKATGMKEEDAQKALEGDMPLYLRGRV